MVVLFLFYNKLRHFFLPRMTGCAQRENRKNRRRGKKIKNASTENLTKILSDKTLAKRKEDVNAGLNTKRETYISLLSSNTKPCFNICSNCKN